MIHIITYSLYSILNKYTIENMNDLVWCAVCVKVKNYSYESGTLLSHNQCVQCMIVYSSI